MAGAGARGFGAGPDGVGTLWLRESSGRDGAPAPQMEPVPGGSMYRRQGPSVEPGNSRTSVRVHSGGLSQLLRSVSSSWPPPRSRPAGRRLARGRGRFRSRSSACNESRIRVRAIACLELAPKLRGYENEALRRNSRRHEQRRIVVSGRSTGSAKRKMRCFVPSG